MQLPKQQMQPLPGCQILVSCGGWSHGQLEAGPMATASWRPTDNSPSVWQQLLCLFMALFSLINPKLVTFSSARGCQGDACPCVTSGEYLPGDIIQLCHVPVFGHRPRSGCSCIPQLQRDQLHWSWVKHWVKTPLPTSTSSAGVWTSWPSLKPAFA